MRITICPSRKVRQPDIVHLHVDPPMTYLLGTGMFKGSFYLACGHTMAYCLHRREKSHAHTVV